MAISAVGLWMLFGGFAPNLSVPVVSEVDAGLWERLDALEEPSALLPTRGVTFIAIEEVGSRYSYDQAYCRPSWPGEESGITIGIGYDLRFASQNTFEQDWRSGLTDDTYEALLPWLGRKGSKEAEASLQGTLQPFTAAWAVFLNRTIPATVDETQAKFIGYDDLPPLCRSALVSLVYNRGTAMEGDRRIEMRAIRDLIAAGHFDAVPGQLVAMQRLWPNTRGLRDRRNREAALWREGLAGWSAG